jgi:O-antigen/teichoic acid export membrane protein
VFKGLAKNVLISAVAYFTVSLLGIIVVAFLIRMYGLVGYGFISLARLFFPTTALALFDFGFGEMSTQVIARARVDNDWDLCGRRLRLVSLLTIAVGVSIGLILVISSVYFVYSLGLNENVRSFQFVIWVTSGLMPIFFLSLVFEGVIKGYECFYEMRVIEVATAIIYAFFVFVVFNFFPNQESLICYSFLASQVIRTVFSAFISAKLLSKEPILFRIPEDEDVRFVKSTTKLMAQNKLLGSIQTQLAPIIVGFSFGPIGLGTFDALSRLPRAVKSVLGLVSSTILPLATKLNELKDNKSISRIGYFGVFWVGALTLPPLAAMIAFSKPILNLWIGPELSILSKWQAFLFLVPAFSVVLSFGGTALLVRPNIVSKMNRLVSIQVLIQFSIALFLSPVLYERAFILGQVLAVIVTFFPQLKLICSEMKISSKVYFELFKLALILISLSVLTYFILPNLTHWSILFMTITSWLVLAYLLIYWILLSTVNRLYLKKIIRKLLNY